MFNLEIYVILTISFEMKRGSSRESLPFANSIDAAESVHLCSLISLLLASYIE